jgi:hypothetical protein
MASPLATRRFPLIMALALVSAGCNLLPTAPEPTPADKGLTPMSGAEVRAVLNTARYRWQSAQGASGTAVTSADGRIRVMWETGAVNGRIRFTDSGYCSRFQDVRNGAEDCYRLYRTGPRDYAVVREDGTQSGTIALLN